MRLFAGVAIAAAIIALRLPSPAGAQLPASDRHAISGMVYDSVSRRPLAGASIQVAVATVPPAGTSYAAVTDSSGRFRIDSVAPGTYLVGFYHPRLDALGVQVAPRVTALPSAQGDAAVELAIPSVSRLSLAICGNGATDDSSATVIGTVLDAVTRAPVAGADVSIGWTEVTIVVRAGGGGGITREPYRLSARTTADGRFALCGLPGGDALALVASSGADSTGMVELPLGAGELVVRDLYLGAAEVDTAGLAPDDAALAVALGAGVRRRVRRGTLQLRGTVTGPLGERLAGARVRLLGTEGEAVSDDSGSFVLRGVPGGTRTLRTRAAGFFPDERGVDVLPGENPLTIRLNDARRMLDSARAGESGARSGGFSERKRRFVGTFFDERWLVRHETDDLRAILKLAAGIRMVGLGGADYAALMSSDAGRCIPMYFIDGVRMPRRVEFRDVDGWVSGRDIAGMEVYLPGDAPAELSDSARGCGSVVIWTRR